MHPTWTGMIAEEAIVINKEKVLKQLWCVGSIRGDYFRFEGECMLALGEHGDDACTLVKNYILQLDELQQRYLVQQFR